MPELGSASLHVHSAHWTHPAMPQHSNTQQLHNLMPVNSLELSPPWLLFLDPDCKSRGNETFLGKIQMTLHLTTLAMGQAQIYSNALLLFSTHRIHFRLQYNIG